MLRTINYTGRSKITKEEVLITLEDSPNNPPTFDVEFGFLDRFPDDSRIYVEVYHKETLERFEFGTIGNVTRPENRAITAVDLTGTMLFRVRVVDESGHVGRLLGAAEALRPEGGEDDDNSDSLMTLASMDLVALPWKVEVSTDGSKPRLLVNNRIPNALNRVKTEPAFYSLILPGALQQVLLRLLMDVPDEEDYQAIEQRRRWIEMATNLESEPPDVEDMDEKISWIERVVEAFCKRKDMTNALVNHLEETEK